MRNPVHRRKAILGDNKIVDRSPSSANVATVLFIIVGLVAIFFWKVEEEQSSEAVIETLPAGNIMPVAGPAELNALIRRRVIKDIHRIVVDMDETELNAVINGMTAVMTASSVGDVEIVELLLNLGADPNKRGSADRTALQYAAEKNRLAVARKLLDYGADIDAYDNTLLTPLVMATDRGYTDLAIFLIESGADVNIQHVQGWTALIDAAKNGNMKLVQHLLTAGANREISTSTGWRAIDFARQKKHQEIVTLLAE
jgi:hypothetical protein